MLELRGIKKDYPAGSGVVHALKGIDLQFRRAEFVSILGPSGCGKTTMLNIIGGLDGYTAGDLIINGTSTKKYRDRHWDTYRNHSVGFVFQSYNLIPHQTVLQNVELALTLSGVSKHERRRRAKEALEKVGLGDQLRKRPSAMSGGQMQRVAIARALVNDPDIILADEPTGALDTVTSVQVMEILKEVAKDRLVIMVTHNPELAEAYSTRIIRMLDGEILEDSAPLSRTEFEAEQCDAQLAAASNKKTKMPSMSFGTSFMLSLKNLFTKKGRTVLTSFAGSIGIIGIALILAVSQGTTNYINHVQQSTLSAYPLTLEAQAVDMSALLESFKGGGSGVEHDTDAIYKDPIIADMVEALSLMETSENDLKAFKAHLEAELSKEDSKLQDAVMGIQYSYSLTPVVYTKNLNGEIIKSDTTELLMEMVTDFMMQSAANGNNMFGGSMSGMMGGSSSTGSSTMMSSMMGLQMWQELLPDLDGSPINSVLKDQYDVIYGAWPNEADEIVLVVNEKNELDDLTLYALGLLGKEDIDAIIDAAASGNVLPPDDSKWSYEDVCGMTFKVILPCDCYQKAEDGTFKDISDNATYLKLLYDKADELRVVGIIRPTEDAGTTMLSGSIGYTHMLTEKIIEDAKGSEVVKAQLADPSIDVLTGLPFESNTGSMTDEEKAAELRAYIATLNEKEKAEAYLAIQCLIAEKENLQTQVDMMLASPAMQDKASIVSMIVNALNQQGGTGMDTVAEELEKYTLEELHEMLRPSLEEQAKSMIAMQVKQGFKDVPEATLASMLDAALAGYTEEECALYYDEITVFSEFAYEDVLTTIGYVDLDSPSAINLYASTFENKDVIIEAIEEYNAQFSEDETDKKIAYTDILGILMSSITIILNAITGVLIAFVSISLIVSSIMIGVITLISVQERTKEIGILRAIGASKRNVSSMFNAETMIIGFASGVLGVGVTYLLCIPINLILHLATGITTLNAFLPPVAAVILVAISVGLTLISGIIPSRSAAKKDPVVALRSE